MFKTLKKKYGPFAGPYSLIVPLVLALTATGECSENIALGSAYSVHPQRKVLKHLESGRDAEKLTDGKFGRHPLWTDNEAAMGWSGSRHPLTVILDLGRIRSIGGGAVSIAGGAEGIPWPGIIAIFVSDDRKTWYPQGDLITAAAREGNSLPPYGEYANRKIATSGLQTFGRYVAFVFARQEDVIIDEIEVYPGEAADLGRSRKAGVTGMKGITESLKDLDTDFLATQRRYLQDIDLLNAKLKGLPEQKAKPLLESLHQLREKAERLERVELPAHPYLPIGELGAEIGKQLAAYWQQTGIPPVVVWASGVWDALQWQGTPPAQNEVAGVKVALMHDEYRATSFNITNATQSDQDFTIRIDGLPGGRNPSYITLDKVGWTESAWGIPTASALTPITNKEDAYTVTIPPGMTQQLWLTVKGPKEAGAFKGSIVVEGADGTAYPAIAMDLTVYPYQFPSQPALSLGGWDYAFRDETVRGVTSKNSQTLIRHLRERFVDSPWATRTIFPFGKFSSEGTYATAEDQPSTEAFDRWVTHFWPDAHHYYLAIGVRNKKRTAAIQGCDADKDPEGFKKRIQTWVQFWKRHIESLGLSTERFSLLLIDEPGINVEKPYEDDEVLKKWVEAIREADTGFRLWLDPVYTQPWNASQEMLDQMDVLCVKFHQNVTEGEKFRNFYQARADKGQEFAVYECRSSPAQIYDPYSYFRLQAWLAWQYRARAMFFWAFSDNGPDRSSWSMLNHRSFTPVFLDSESVVGSKQMEAIREGIEDYQTLEMLRTTVVEVGRSDPENPALSAARRLLAEAAKRVLWESDALEEPKWFWPKPIDRTVADDIRLQALELMTKLTRKP